MKSHQFEPIRELMNIQERMNQLFGDLGVPMQVAGEPATANWTPCADIYETPQEIVMLVDLPEVQQENIQLSLEQDRLVLKGERPFPADIPRESFHRIERSYGTFARVFSLPPTVNQDQIRADYAKSGVLKITLPKREPVQSRQIKVETN
ncbi:MAG: Hsp20/alpha crystallin family protein [Blastocatellia bacterium]|nr:Hsp20/alpha crystallin family protein [Blastocatellia bacterium]